ncbi:MAG: FG-GAP repeat protein [Candidatus Heimdallarchaeota archaeon]|nr:MAG: FG-GAP repeat protein [Candidatus Heimdallarchaeota archaeon]
MKFGNKNSLFLGFLITFSLLLLQIILFPICFASSLITEPVSSFMAEGSGYSFVGEEIFNLAGFHAYSIGDFNNDGFDDFVIGASHYNGSWMHGYGKIYLFWGRPTEEWASHPLSETSVSFIGESDSENLGRWCASLGDVNGDGFDDFAASAVRHGNWSGKTYIFFGKSEISWDPETLVSEAANASFIGENIDDWSGHGVYGLGDVNNDDYNDLLISGEWNDEGGLDTGQVYLILGRPTDQWTKNTHLPQGANASFIGNSTFLGLGGDAAGIGDVNDDGYNDFAVFAQKNNDLAINLTDYRIRDELPPTLPSRQVFLIFGRPTNHWQMSQSISDANASMLYERWWGPSNDFISGANDVNGDGIDDFLVGSYMDDTGATDAGRTYLYFGRPTEQWTLYPQADVSFVSSNPNQWSGFSVAGVNDVNNDGYADILIGAPENFLVYDNDGSAYLFYGRPTEKWQLTLQLSQANISFTRESHGDAFGTHVAGVGDVNNDGFHDFVMNAAAYEDWKGKTYLILGRSDFTITSTDTITTTPTTSISDSIPDTNTTSTTTILATNGTAADFILMIPVVLVLATIHKRRRKNT